MSTKMNGTKTPLHDTQSQLEIYYRQVALNELKNLEATIQRDRSTLSLATKASTKINPRFSNSRYHKVIDLIDMSEHCYEKSYQSYKSHHNETGVAMYLKGYIILTIIIPGIGSDCSMWKNDDVELFNTLKRLYEESLNTELMRKVVNDLKIQDGNMDGKVVAMNESFSADQQLDRVPKPRSLSPIKRSTANVNLSEYSSQGESQNSTQAPTFKGDQAPPDYTYTVTEFQAPTDLKSRERLDTKSISSAEADTGDVLDIYQYVDTNGGGVPNSPEVESTLQSPSKVTETNSSMDEFVPHIDVATLNGILFSPSVQSKKILLLDLRSSVDFEKSRIRYQNIVNIEAHVLRSSTSDQQIEKLLQMTNPTFYQLFSTRDQFSTIIYFDKDSKVPSNDMTRLYNMLTSLNTSKMLSDLPIFLQGGMDEWLKYYSTEPMKVFYADRKLKGPRKLPESAPPPIPNTDYLKPLTQTTSYLPRAETQINSSPHRPRQNTPPKLFSHNDRTSTTPFNNGDQYNHTIPQYRAKQVLHPSHALSTIPPPIDQAQVTQTRKPVYEELSICGLKNFGSTCYINSMVQCLFSFGEFKKIFLTDQFTRYLTRSPTNTLALSVAGLFRSMTANGGMSISPTRFLSVCNYYRPDLRIPQEQQDTQEFLMFILDKIHEELNYPSIVKLDFPHSTAPQLDDKQYRKWFSELTEKEGVSPISTMFQGQLKSTLICNQCGNQSGSFTQFQILSLPIPPSHHNMVAVNDCINHFIQPEVLRGDNAWSCPECEKREKRRKEEMSQMNNSVFNDEEKKRSRKLFKMLGSKEKHSPNSNHSKANLVKTSQKALSFISLPQYLVIHLSRFNGFSPQACKLDVTIAYPLILEIPIHKEDGSMNVARYKLCSLINHFGSLKSGHYTAVVNKSGHLHNPYWCYFDDESVRPGISHGDLNLGINMLSSRDVYVLFYERIA